ncbi:hypothetical protein HGB24_03010 [Candidatus Saccharibacteria bacterium]|nr:hypothetical protein [Candidatus Saccharibacteria bacterium]
MEPNNFDEQNQTPEASPPSELMENQPANSDQTEVIDNNTIESTPVSVAPQLVEQEISTEAPVAETSSTVAPAPITNNQPAKKQSHKLVTVLIIIAVLAILSAVGYLVYSYINQSSNQSTNNTNNSKTETSQKGAITPVSTSNSSVDDTVNSLINSLGTESDLVSTDDSSMASDASTATNNVGGSIDESNF